MYVMYVLMKWIDRSTRLKTARLSRGYETARSAALAHGWNPNSYTSNENGNSPYSFKMAKAYGAAFGVAPEWLYDGATASDEDVAVEPSPEVLHERLVPVVGRVGADADCAILFATGQSAGDLVPLPPGGGPNAVAVLIAGHSMRGFADDGGLIYFEDQRTPPSLDMLGHVVVLETDQDEVLVKRLLRGSRSGRFDLESLAGPTRRDCRLRWAAHITAIVPPFQARRIIRSSGA